MHYVNVQRAWIAMVLGCAFTSGCVINERAVYGIDWADKVQLEGDECPVVDGEYQNAGERFASGTYERQDVSLAHLFNGGREKWHNATDRLGRTAFDPAEDGFKKVRLQLLEGSLYVEATREDGSTRAFNVPTSRECHDSTMFLEGNWGDSATMVFASAVARSTVALGRAEDGSLLVRESDTGVGFVLWLPIVAGRFSEWTKFPPVAPGAESAAEQVVEIAL